MYIGELGKIALEFISNYIAEKGYAPTFAEIGAGLGMSKSRAFQVVKELEKNKKVKIKPNVIRGLIIK